MNEETHSCPFTLPPHTLAAATLLAGCCHPGRLAQSTLGDLPLCQQWSISDHAQPAQSCRHSCGQLGGWPSPTGRAGSQPNCNTLPACPSVFCLFHLMLPVCLCVSVCLSNLVKVRASLNVINKKITSKITTINRECHSKEHLFIVESKHELYVQVTIK